MSSQYCPICFFPVYIIIPGYVSGHDSGHVWEYTCLYSACNNFKVSMPESGIIINSDVQVSDASVDYPSWPLEQEPPDHTSGQTWFARPHPQQFMQPGPIATAIDVNRQVSGGSNYSSWPVHEELLGPTGSQTRLSQPYYAQHTQQVGVTQAWPGPATTVARDKTRKHSCKKAPAKRGGKKVSGPRPKKSSRAHKLDDLPALEKPLSELLNTEGSDLMTGVTNHVNRPLDRRHQEAKVDGRVKRPLNAYILYRMACHMQEAFPKKEYLFDQQKISRVLGQSWAMESDRVREQFNELAAKERALHHQAFPDYRFDPHGPRGKRTFEDEEL